MPIREYVRQLDFAAHPPSGGTRKAAALISAVAAPPRFTQRHDALLERCDTAEELRHADDDKARIRRARLLSEAFVEGHRIIADAADGETRYADSLRRALKRGLKEPIERASELLVAATAEFTTSMTRIKVPTALETQHRAMLNAAARGQALALERVQALKAGEV